MYRTVENSTGGRLISASTIYCSCHAWARSPLKSYVLSTTVNT